MICCVDISGNLRLNFIIFYGKLTASQSRSKICGKNGEVAVWVIPKKNQDHTIITNLRPITLSNTDLKILSTIIAKRLQNINLTNPFIHPDQTGFMARRQITNTILRFINYCASDDHGQKSWKYVIGVQIDWIINSFLQFDGFGECKFSKRWDHQQWNLRAAGWEGTIRKS